MRESQKKEIISTIDLLDKAHNAVKKAMETGNRDAALTLLEQCQDSAIQIGGMIEESEGEDFVTISLLENYCEQLYQIYEQISRQTVPGGKVYKNLRKDLIRIENSVKNDICVRTSAVFLPYKASMWDSLESVWKAADADPDCDAYVIPIPYFDKNPDGSFSRMHYEGDQYPSYVPVISWEVFDLAKEHPDVIYIHNPYDECNHVTSVHPYFYAKELRNYTDKLVYIPYFILKEIDPKDQAAIDSMKHFCFTPGTVYANQVIVQSENIRQIYINEYIKAAKEMGLPGEHVDRKFLEKKFLGTGSPKIDKVLNTRKEDLEIPAGWLKIIEKPDGNWKKIIFYNTSVGALLQHSENMLRKMESVFEIFRENQDEVALLWRPHPLIQATIESMRPQLWEAYKKIRDRYIEEGWGIYDDSADLDRAVIISDAYYGDHSSVVQLCEKDGKPTLIQNVRKVNERNFENSWLVSRGAEFDDENRVLWMVTAYTSTLVKVDVGRGILLNCYQIPIRGIKDYDFIDVIKVGDQLYLIPFNADDMYRFHINEERFEKIELPLLEQEKSKTAKFGQAFQTKDMVYIVGYNLPLVIILNLRTLEMKRIEGFHTGGDAMARDAIMADDDIYVPYYKRNMILHIRTKDDSWEEIVIENSSSKGIGTITEADRGFIITDLEDNRVSYFRDENKIVACNLQMVSKCQCEHPEIPYYYQYQRVFRYGEKEYYFPICKAAVWMIDEKNGKKELQYEYPYDSRMDFDYYSKFEMLSKHGNKIYFQARTNGDIFTIDLDTDIIQRYAIQISDECKKNLLSALMQYKYWHSVNETDIYSLNMFIKYALCDERKQNNY